MDHLAAVHIDQKSGTSGRPPLWMLVVVLSTSQPEAVPWTTADLLAMFVISLLLTPLQATGEEYGLRGLVLGTRSSSTRRWRPGSGHDIGRLPALGSRPLPPRPHGLAGAAGPWAPSSSDGFTGAASTSG